MQGDFGWNEVSVDNIGSLPFISWVISMKHSGYYFFMPSTNVPVSLKNIQK
jgi:hypothetical protein